MMKREKDATKEKISKSAASGAVALIFLILGFQLAIFVMKVVERPAPAGESAEEAAQPAEYGASAPADGETPPDYGPETRYAPREGRPAASRRTSSGKATGSASRSQPQRSRYGGYEAPAKPYSRPPRKVESFPFDPNTVTLEELVRLGLSERQAESILNYREKGGRFRSKEDFKKMYVVSDTLYERLEPYIDIPKLELNAADSAALVGLRGIGPWYAHKILEYRESLGGFHSPEQLLEIYGMDEERFAPLREQVRADASLIRRLDIWNLSEEEMALHPYVGRAAARSIVRYRRVSDSAARTLAGLLRENAIDSARYEKLRYYVVR